MAPPPTRASAVNRRGQLQAAKQRALSFCPHRVAADGQSRGHQRSSAEALPVRSYGRNANSQKLQGRLCTHNGACVYHSTGQCHTSSTDTRIREPYGGKQKDTDCSRRQPYHDGACTSQQRQQKPHWQPGTAAATGANGRRVTTVRMKQPPQCGREMRERVGAAPRIGLPQCKRGLTNEWSGRGLRVGDEPGSGCRHDLRPSRGDDWQCQ